MPVTRREFSTASFAFAAPLRAASPAWTREWDVAVLGAAAAAQDGAYDEREHLIRRHLGGEYIYHSALRNQDVHLTRESLEYALLLLELGGEARVRRAHEVIARVLELQDTDAQSKWYGIWGWYAEEPPSKMTPAADWNWADFNGSLLLLIEHGHGGKLERALRAKVREGIRHAAASVRRRNVAMTYTNIAVQGTFVTLAAAELLEDRDLMEYAVERLRRFARTVDETGSFAEYNSPTYVNVSIANLTRMRMVVKHAASLDLAARIHERAWLHLGKHWHVASKQLAGPMSRCYSTDIGKPLWLQKSLGGRLAWATLDDVKERRAAAPAEVAMLAYRCPETVAPMFLEAGAARQHRELFVPNVQGTTWLEKGFALGSANRGNFWVQSRPLVAYWPGGWAQMRMLKDDYDFASGLLYTAQERNCVLGLATFRTPGGDKHPSLDPVRDGEFHASRLRLRLDVSGGGRYVVDGDRVAVECGAVKLWLRVPAADFGGYRGKLSVAREGAVLAVSFDLLEGARTVRWAETPRAFAVFQLAMEESGEGLEKFAARWRATESGGGWRWSTPAGVLEISGPTGPGPIARQDAAYVGKVNGAVVPLVRLSEVRLV